MATDFTRSIISTPRLETNVWSRGPVDGVPLLLVHGNLVTGGWWKYVAEHLPGDIHVIAPDLRGFGRSEVKPVDATKGLGEMADDLRSLLETLGLADQGIVNAAGWSMGGGVLQQYLLSYPEDLAAVTLIAPLSPYGFGGTLADGSPAYADFAASGGGGAAPEFVSRVAAKDSSEVEPTTSPRMVIRTYFGPRENLLNVDEEFLVEETLLTATGADNYPGDGLASENWPGLAPGTGGVLNAMSPKYFDTSALAYLERKVPIAWIRGTQDQVVSDLSMFDLATLGQFEAIPGWPGPHVLPPQPMEVQMREVLGRYSANGGSVVEVTFEGAAHGMPVEVPERIANEIAGRLIGW